MVIPELCEDVSQVMGNCANSENLFKTGEQKQIFNFFQVSLSSSYELLNSKTDSEIFQCSI